MLVFACKRSEDTFACVKSMAPKNVFEMAKRLYSSALQNVRESSWISVNPKPEAHNAATDSESTIKKSIGSRNDPDEAKSSSATWTVATSAPHQATGNRALISGFVTEHEDQFVHAIDGVPMKVVARGAVVTDAMVLPDVWFVPGLAENLVSVSQLAELDYSVGFSCGECCIRSAAGGKIVGTACLREGGLYVLDFLKVPLAM